MTKSIFCLVLLLGCASFIPVAAQTWNAIDTTIVVSTNSALDWTSGVDAPAGKYGFLKADSSGNFYFENLPGKNVRFYGTSLSGGALLANHSYADTIARQMAAMGYNAVRFLGHDSMEWANGIFAPPTSMDVSKLQFRSYTGKNDGSALDNMDYLIYVLKSKGIYINIDLRWEFSYFLVPEIQPYLDLSNGKAGLYESTYLAMFIPSVRDVYKKSIDLWLNHVNPYTGLKIKDDPAIMTISPWNESALLAKNSATSTFSAVMLQQFNAFRASKGLASATSFPLPFWTQVPWSMQPSMLDFYSYKTTEMYSDVKAYLQKNIGAKSLIGGLNHLNCPLINNWRAQYADIVESHLYYQVTISNSGNFGGDFAYNATLSPPISTVMSMTATGSNTARINSYPSFAFSSVYGKPLMISEWRTTFPIPSRDQSNIFIAAIGAFQDWDCLVSWELGGPPSGFSWNFATTNAREGAADSFSLGSDHVAWLGEYVSNFLFRRAGIQSGKPRFVFVYDRNYCRTSQYAPYPYNSVAKLYYLPYLYNIQSVYADIASGQTGLPVGTNVAVYRTTGLTTAQIASGNIPIANLVSADLVTTPSTTMSDFKTAAQTFINALLNSTDSSEVAIATKQNAALNGTDCVLLSETGQLAFDVTQSRFTVDTSYAGAVAGVMNGATVTLTNSGISFQTAMTNAAISAFSIDGKTLNQSTRILVVHTTEVKSGETTYTTDSTTGNILYSLSNYPSDAPTGTKQNLALYTTGIFTLNTSLDASTFKAYKLSVNGTRLAEIPVTVTGKQVSVPLATDKGFVFEIVSSLQSASSFSGSAYECVLDNANGTTASGSVTITGSWSTSTTALNYWGGNYLVNAIAPNPTGANKVTWTPNLPQEGDYDVYLWLSSSSTNRSASTNFVVNSYAGPQSILINEQTIPGGTWNSLGTYHFSAGASGYVEVNDLNAPSGYYIVADAVAFVLSKASVKASSTPQLLNVVSRKTHGKSGTIDLPIYSSSYSVPNIEPRQGTVTGTHQLIFSFDQNITAGSVAVTSGVGAVSGAATFSGKDMLVTLSGVSDLQTITLTLTNVQGTQGLYSGTFKVRMLFGDANRDGSVNALDSTLAGALSGKTVDASNVTADVLADGSINTTDINRIRMNNGHILP